MAQMSSEDSKTCRVTEMARVECPSCGRQTASGVLKVVLNLTKPSETCCRCAMYSCQSETSTFPSKQRQHWPRRDEEQLLKSFVAPTLASLIAAVSRSRTSSTSQERDTKSARADLRTISVSPDSLQEFFSHLPTDVCARSFDVCPRLFSQRSQASREGREAARFPRGGSIQVSSFQLVRGCEFLKTRERF